MISDLRHKRILEKIEADDTVVVSELVKEFNVSEMTIRRDLIILENRGLLRRVHGGAVSQRGRSYEPPYLARTSENLEAKQRIGRAAAEVIQNGDSITLDVGTTTLEIARNLHAKQGLTVITPSLRIANELIDHPGIRLILTGGILRSGEFSMVGHLAERIFADFFVDKLFLGGGAVDMKVGVSEFNIEDTLVKRAMLKSAKKVYLVADSSKFRQVAFTSIVPMSGVHTVITDTELDSQTASLIRKQNIELILA
ncbi:MAG: DeoR/GlpR transcriptional regulator [Chloroflexi bacterium]|nr:DeoR/GlpR transcriptional regulator [Anaerolinea sp.]TDA66752.1 MAG: DeoR/GlpR transcriptional regulator [Chloroflexota bacterium]